MPRLTPISRRKLIRRLTKLGFTGPYIGGRHQFMLRGNQRLILPNPHEGDISNSLTKVGRMHHTYPAAPDRYGAYIYIRNSDKITYPFVPWAKAQG